MVQFYTEITKREQTDMTAAVIICAVILISLTASILFFPSVKIGRLKLDTYWMTALAGAAVLLISGVLPISELWQKLTLPSDMNPLKILVLFFSMTALSVFLDEVGLFRYFAGQAVKIAGKKQISLFISLYALTALLTVFTSNDIVILTLTPFICFFCKNTGIDPIPYLVSEFAAANTWSMMLIIGNPTNIYLATSAGISFTDYFHVMVLPTLAAGILEFALILLVFGKKLKKPMQKQKDDFHIESRQDLWIGCAHLVICLVFLIISGYINVPMWIISAVCALSLAAFASVAHMISGRHNSYLANTFMRLPWQLIPFVLAMFTVVICLNYTGVSAAAGQMLGSRNVIFTYGISSYLSSNLINNIPMSILFSGFPSGLGAAAVQAVYATVIGSNIGAFLTPIGALAGIMFTGLTRRHGVKYGFAEFMKYGVIISLPTIICALFVLTFVLG